MRSVHWAAPSNPTVCVSVASIVSLRSRECHHPALSCGCWPLGNLSSEASLFWILLFSPSNRSPSRIPPGASRHCLGAPEEVGDDGLRGTESNTLSLSTSPHCDPPPGDPVATTRHSLSTRCDPQSPKLTFG